jgi:hypothetical protein
MEVSRTQVFADPEQGWALVEASIRDNLDRGRPDRVSLIFSRQVTKRTPSEFHTRVLREGVQPTVCIHYKHSALKQYLKDCRALRTEMMFNNTQDFGFTCGLQNFTAGVWESQSPGVVSGRSPSAAARLAPHSEQTLGTCSTMTSGSAIRQRVTPGCPL